MSDSQAFRCWLVFPVHKVNLLAQSMRPIIVGVGGFTSQVGKTTLLCDLLQAFPGWEAIKTTRGHYRSCGKDPHACCVSHLLADEPVVSSGREQTNTAGKDTGRYWDSGAANVHWVVATDGQVEEGIKLALNRVQTTGVFIEGNSFTKYIQPDYFVMVARVDDLKIKTTAKEALNRVSVFYVSGGTEADKELLSTFLMRQSLIADQPQVQEPTEFAKLTASIRASSSSITTTVQKTQHLRVAR